MHEKTQVQSNVFISRGSNRFVASARGVSVVEALLLAEHGVFRLFDTNSESRPKPPDKKQNEHNGGNYDHD
jgi:hypothetical protein